MKIKFFAIVLFLTSSFGAKAQSIYYLDTNGASFYLNLYGAPSEINDFTDYCVCIGNDPLYGGWAGQFDKTFTTGGDGATGISFVVRMDECDERVVIYEGGQNNWVPKAVIWGYGIQYYATYNITSGYYGLVKVRIIKNSIDDYSDGWSEWDFHYLRGIWWYPTW